MNNEEKLRQLDELIKNKGKCDGCCPKCPIGDYVCLSNSHSLQLAIDVRDDLKKEIKMKEIELKAGDLVVYHKEKMSDCGYVHDMDILLDGKPHKILSIEKDDKDNTVFAEIEGVGHPYWYDKEALEKVDAPKEKEGVSSMEDVELKVDDYVVYHKEKDGYGYVEDDMDILLDGKPHKILSIEKDDEDNTVYAEIEGVEEPYWYKEEAFEKVDAPKEFDGDKVAEKVTMQEFADMYHVYVAMDKNGSVWYFSNEPVRHNVAWGISTEGTFDSITDIVQKPDCDWKDSLCEPHKETVAETVSRAPRLYHTPCGDFTEGERVITGCDDERIFYSYDANLKEPYSCVVGWCEEEYKNGEKIYYSYMG